MNGSISGAELEIFEACAHAPIYEKVDEFNRKTLAFLQRQAA
jgi:pimeloyl-ACP methyl ester carboxylesterase